MRAAAAALAAVGLLALLGPAAAGADTMRLQSVGVAPARAGAPTSALRRAALEAGVADAVVRAGQDLARRGDPEADVAAVAATLGADPFAYAARYRMLEDRGERPALFSQAEGVESEYVVLVEALVDLDRVRGALEAAGLLAPPAPVPSGATVWLTLEPLPPYAGYQQVVEALRAHAGAVQPRELGRGRALLQVEGAPPADVLVRRAAAGLAPGQGLEIVARDGDVVVVRLVSAPAGIPDPSGFDEARRNRY